MIPVKTNLVNDGLDLLLAQFNDKPNVVETIRSYLDQVNITDQNLFDFVNSFNIDDATGILLDFIGAIVGVPRNGDTDDDYRERIRNGILLNNSDGTPNSLLEALATATNGNTRIWEHFPVSYIMYTDGENVTPELANSIRQAGPITSELVDILHDTTKMGFRHAEFLPVTTEIIDDVGDNIVDFFGDNIIARDFVLDTSDDRSKLAEYYSLPEVLIDDVGDEIIDDVGDVIILVDSGNPILQTPDLGVLVEVIRGTE